MRIDFLFFFNYFHKKERICKKVFFIYFLVECLLQSVLSILQEKKALHSM